MDGAGCNRRWVAIFFSILWLATTVPGNAADRLCVLKSADQGVVLNRGKTRLKNPAAGMAIRFGDTIETRGGAAVVLYPDGATLSLRPNTEAMLAEREASGGGPSGVEREIHLYMGAVHYRRGDDDVTLKLISMTTATTFHGESVEFETDGVFTYVNGMEVLLGGAMAPLDMSGAEDANRDAAEKVEDAYINAVKSVLE